jgi:hypothetical protein
MSAGRSRQPLAFVDNRRGKFPRRFVDIKKAKSSDFFRPFHDYPFSVFLS